MELNLLDDGAGADWTQVAPVLEEALQELPGSDRDAIVLRYLDGQPFARVGALLGVSEDAARMRVERAVERLRGLLARRGVTSTAAALALAFGQHGIVAAPAGLAATVSAAAVLSALSGATGAAAIAAAGASATASAGGGTAGSIGVLGVMNSTKLAWGLTGLLAVGSAGVGAKARWDTQRLAAEAEVLRAELAVARNEVEAAQAGDAARLEEARREREQLMALRGQIGPLRDAARELADLREENQRLAAALAAGGAVNPPEQAAEKDEGDMEAELARASGLLRLSYAKVWALAFHLFAAENDDRIPATFAEAEKYFPPEHKAVMSVFDPNRFEIVYQGRLSDIASPNATILLREKEPFAMVSKDPESTGKLAKTYAFADGHSEIHIARDGRFEEWERARMVSGGR